MKQFTESNKQDRRARASTDARATTVTSERGDTPARTVHVPGQMQVGGQAHVQGIALARTDASGRTDARARAVHVPGQMHVPGVAPYLVKVGVSEAAQRVQQAGQRSRMREQGASLVPRDAVDGLESAGPLHVLPLAHVALQAPQHLLTKARVSGYLRTSARNPS